MSFDPYGTPPNPNDPTAPYDHPDDRRGRPDVKAARDRLHMPGIFLIVIGVLNLLPAGYCAFVTVSTWMQDADAMHAQALAVSRKALADMKNIPEDNFLKKVMAQAVQQMENTPAADLKTRALWQNGLSGLGLGLVALVQIFGGMGMLSRKWYVLSFIASLLSAIPFLSLTGCCCVGQGVGIWAIVALLNEEVRAAYR